MVGGRDGLRLGVHDHRHRTRLGIGAAELDDDRRRLADAVRRIRHHDECTPPSSSPSTSRRCSSGSRCRVDSADAIGARRLGIIAVSGFGLCSAAAMFAPTFAVARRHPRVPSGVRLGVVAQRPIPAPRAITTPTERGRAFGVQGSVIGVGAGLGPVIGGLLLAGFGWRAIFAINIPIVIVVLFVLQRSVPVEPGTARDPARRSPSASATSRRSGSEGSPSPDSSTASSAPRSQRRRCRRSASTHCSSSLRSCSTIAAGEPDSIGIALSTLTLGMIVMGPPAVGWETSWGRRRSRR